MHIKQFANTLLKGFDLVPALRKHSYAIYTDGDETRIGIIFNPSGVRHSISVDDIYAKCEGSTPMSDVVKELAQNLIMLNQLSNNPEQYQKTTPEMENSLQLCVVSKTFAEKCQGLTSTYTTCTVHGITFAFCVKEGTNLSLIDVPGFVNNSKDIQHFYQRAVTNMLHNFDLVVEPISSDHCYSIRVKDELGVISGLLASVRLLKKVSELPDINGSFYALVLFNVFIVMPAVTSSESEQLLMRKALEVAMQGQDADKILAFYNCVTNKVTILSNSFKTNVGRGVI